MNFSSSSINFANASYFLGREGGRFQASQIVCPCLTLPSITKVSFTDVSLEGIASFSLEKVESFTNLAVLLSHTNSCFARCAILEDPLVVVLADICSVILGVVFMGRLAWLLDVSLALLPGGSLMLLLDASLVLQLDTSLVLKLDASLVMLLDASLALLVDASSALVPDTSQAFLVDASPALLLDASPALLLDASLAFFGGTSMESLTLLADTSFGDVHRITLDRTSSIACETR